MIWLKIFLLIIIIVRTSGIFHSFHSYNPIRISARPKWISQSLCKFLSLLATNSPSPSLSLSFASNAPHFHNSLKDLYSFFSLIQRSRYLLRRFHRPHNRFHRCRRRRRPPTIRLMHNWNAMHSVEILLFSATMNSNWNEHYISFQVLDSKRGKRRGKNPLILLSSFQRATMAKNGENTKCESEKKQKRNAHCNEICFHFCVCLCSSLPTLNEMKKDVNLVRRSFQLCIQLVYYVWTSSGLEPFAPESASFATTSIL